MRDFLIREFGRFPKPRLRRHEARTSDYSINARDSGMTFSNLGATGAVTLTLPQECRKGTHYQFAVGAAFQLQIDPGAAGAVYINGAKQTDDKHVYSKVIGAELMVESDGDGDWYASGHNMREVSAEYNASSVDKRIFTTPTFAVIYAIDLTVTVAGTDGSDVTVMPRRCATGTAITSGIALLASELDLKGTADTVQNGTLAALEANRKLQATNSVALDFTGTLTSATGVLTMGISDWGVQV